MSTIYKLNKNYLRLTKSKVQSFTLEYPENLSVNI